MVHSVYENLILAGAHVNIYIYNELHIETQQLSVRVSLVRSFYISVTLCSN